MNDSDATEPIQDMEPDEGEREDASSPGPASPSPVLREAGAEDGAGGGESRHSELARLIEDAGKTAEESRRAEEEEKKEPAKEDAPEEDPAKPSVDEPLSAEQAAAEQSGSYVYPDSGAASSQRMRLIPPDGKRQPWWLRHRRELTAVEWFLTGFFFLLAVYFLYLWLFGAPALACVPGPEWKMAAEPGRWRYIVVHHTATERSSPASIDRYHREVRKWEGLGYHFLIGNGKTNGRDPTLGDGAVHAGIRWLEQRGGAHVRMKDVDNANRIAIGIALIGNFETTPPTPRQIAALRCLLTFLSREYKIPHKDIFGHGDVSAKHTLCPGKLLHLPDIVASLPD